MSAGGGTADTVIAGVRVFDGEVVVDGARDVAVADGRVRAVDPAGTRRDDGATIVEGRGATLLPGLIDSHVHAGPDALREAVAFGVTTVLDMGGSTGDQIDPLRRAAATDPRVADIRSCLTGLTRPDGHPHQFVGDLGDSTWPTARTVDEVPRFVAGRVAEGADYFKAWLEDGRLLGHAVPPLDPALLAALVACAHEHDRRVYTHALTRETAERAVAAGVDGLTHMVADGPVTPELVSGLADSGAHVVPTLGLLASLSGDPGAAALAGEPRPRALLSSPWSDSIGRTWSTLPLVTLDDALAGVGALHAAGVPVLAGTDASGPDVPGLAHGLSLHGELRLLVRAGLSPIDALRAATSLPAHRFSLDDRGRVAPGYRADLLMVDGDPTRRVDETMAILGVWRGGLPAAGPAR